MPAMREADHVCPNVRVLNNVPQNIFVEVVDETGEGKPIAVRSNVMANSRIEHKSGNLME